VFIHHLRRAEEEEMEAKDGERTMKDGEKGK
jgi:hypothetical protein